MANEWGKEGEEKYRWLSCSLGGKSQEMPGSLVLLAEMLLWGVLIFILCWFCESNVSFFVGV